MDQRVVQLHTLEDAQYNAVCPVNLLIIHGLRRGAIFGADSVDAVMLDGKTRGALLWKKDVLELPVICAIDPPGKNLLFDRPASALQVLNTVKAAGLYAGLLAPIVSHDIRRGSAHDFANLPNQTGVATLKTALQVGHSSISFATGITQKYLDTLNEDHWGPRLAAAEAQAGNLFGPQLADGPLTLKRLRTSDVETECRKRGIDPQHYKQRELVRHDMKKQGTKDMLSDTVPVFHDPKTLPTAGAPPRSIRPPLMEWPTNASIGASKRQKLSHMEAESPIDPLLLQPDVATAKSMPIDTTDLHEDASGLGWADAEAEYMQDLLPATIPDGLIEDLMPPDGSQPLLDVITAPAVKFMAYFTDIKVVLSRVLRPGESRFEYSCKNSIHGCPYVNVFPKEIANHEPKCPYDGVYIPPDRPFACIQCPSTFKDKDGLTTHVKRIHSWKPTKCLKCPNGPVYTDKKELRKHNEKTHSASSRFQPQKCNVNGCTSQHTFENERNFKKHLDGIHHLVGDNLRQHIEMARLSAVEE
jgi:hypothetical protein